jgi:oligoendopeptidase F
MAATFIRSIPGLQPRSRQAQTPDKGNRMTSSIKPVRGEEFSRTFTANLDSIDEWGEIEPLFETLLQEGGDIQSVEALESWLLKQSELGAVLDEEYSRRYIAMTCDTEGKEKEKAYLHFIEGIMPKTQPYWDRLNRAFLKSPARMQLDPKRYAVLDRDIENDVKLFREENIPLQTENSKLAQQYQKICGAMTVAFRGEEKTLQQMAPYLEENDRALREEAWRLVSARRLEDAKAIDDLLDKMIEVRQRIAKNAGFANYRDYIHQAKARFDYTPEDCFAFHEAVEKEIVPLLARVREERLTDLGVDSLRPWDLGNDSKGRAPLRPFKETQRLEEGCQKIFDAVSSDLGSQFRMMRENGLLDLDSRKGKAPGGYQSTLEEIRYPFIFMNAAGTDRDVYTLLHEGGHAFHAFAARQDPLLFYRHAPLEFCEVASMTMELLAYDHLEAFYDRNDAERSRRHHTEQLLAIFPHIASIDAFQHWLYTTDDPSANAREAKWLELDARFGPGVNWTGLEKQHRSVWQRQLHIFQVPFYYIEYGIAQLGALQIWLKSKSDLESAIQQYRRGLALGGSRPLPELFETSGAKFDFSTRTIAPIAEAIREELDSAA